MVKLIILTLLCFSYSILPAGTATVPDENTSNISVEELESFKLFGYLEGLPGIPPMDSSSEDEPIQTDNSLVAPQVDTSTTYSNSNGNGNTHTGEFSCVNPNPSENNTKPSPMRTRRATKFGSSLSKTNTDLACGEEKKSASNENSKVSSDDYSSSSSGEEWSPRKSTRTTNRKPRNGSTDNPKSAYGRKKNFTFKHKAELVMKEPLFKPSPHTDRSEIRLKLLERYKKDLNIDNDITSINWMGVVVHNWPTEVKSKNPRGWNAMDKRILKENLDKIYFSAKTQPILRSFQHLENKSLHDRLSKAAILLGFSLRRGSAINWEMIEKECHFQAPNRDYQSWTAEDRAIIEEVLLNGIFMPLLKQLEDYLQPKTRR